MLGRYVGKEGGREGWRVVGSVGREVGSLALHRTHAGKSMCTKKPKKSGLGYCVCL